MKRATPEEQEAHLEHLRRIETTRGELEEQLAAVHTTRNRAIRAAIEASVRARAIGDAIGLTHQRVYQIAKEGE